MFFSRRSYLLQYFLTIGAFLFFASLATAQSTESETVYANADRLLQAGDIVGAIQLYESFQPSEDQYYQHWYNLGVLLYDNQQYDEAVDAFSHAMDQFENLDVAAVQATAGLYNLGTSLIQAGGFSEAIEVFSVLLENEVDDSYAICINRGNAYYAIGDLDAAASDYLAAITARPTTEAWYNLGNIYYDQQSWDEAIAAYSNAIDLNPAFWQAHYNLGNVRMQLLDYDTAIQEYRAALRHEPANADIQENIAIAQQMAEQY